MKGKFPLASIQKFGLTHVASIFFSPVANGMEFFIPKAYRHPKNSLTWHANPSQIPAENPL